MKFWWLGLGEWKTFLKPNTKENTIRSKCFWGEANVLQYFGNVNQNLPTPNVFSEVMKVKNHDEL